MIPTFKDFARQGRLCFPMIDKNGEHGVRNDASAGWLASLVCGRKALNAYPPHLRWHASCAGFTSTATCKGRYANGEGSGWRPSEVISVLMSTEIIKYGNKEERCEYRKREKNASFFNNWEKQKREVSNMDTHSTVLITSKQFFISWIGLHDFMK